MSNIVYNKKQKIFETPAKMKKRMVSYLEWIDEKNEPKTQQICKKCGEKKKTKRSTCCGVGFELRTIEVPNDKQLRPSIHGFAAYAGTTAKTIWKYSKKSEEFSDVVEWFKTVLQADIEQILLNPYTKNTQGAKFVAINNYGWAERQEVTGKDGGAIVFEEVRNKILNKVRQEKNNKK